MTKPIRIKDLTIGIGLPKVCVPLTGTTQEKLLQEAADAKAAQPDLVEWRADFYEGLFSEEKLTETLQKISEILNSIPLLFTIRTSAEGGNVEISLEDYVAINELAAKSGFADLIDVEVFGENDRKKSLIRILHTTPAKVIASSHDFEKTDDKETLLNRFKQMDETGADILKMAVMPKEFDDVAAIMQVTHEMVSKYTEKPVISMSMGEAGKMSRIAGENFGSSVTFATVGAASAPGQIPIRDLRIMMQALHEKNQNN